MELNDKNIKRAVAGDVLRDAKMPGLHLRFFAHSASYYYRYRTRGGIERRPKLGGHPLLSITQARELARALMLEVAAGHDPRVDRRASMAEPTMTALCEQYMREYAPRKKTAHEDQTMINATVIPRLGKLRVADVRRADVAAIHEAMVDTPYQANRVLALLSTLFTLSEMWGYRPANSKPTRFVPRYPEKKRRRIMGSDEAAAISAALAKRAVRRPEAVAIIWMLTLTGARAREVYDARWEWLEGSVLKLPDSKTGAKPVYLPRQVMELLEPMRKPEGLIFKGKRPREVWDAVRTEAGCPDLRLHDLRRTFASQALSMGMTLDQIGELFGHASTQTTAGYAWMVPTTAQQAVEGVAAQLETLMRVAA